MNQRVAAILFALTLVCQICGALLHGSPSDPDAVFGVTQVLGVFLVFLAWWLALVTLGYGLLKTFNLENLRLGGALAVGSLAFMSIATMLGHLSLIGPDNQIIFRLLLISAPAVNFVIHRDEPPRARSVFNLQLCETQFILALAVIAVLITIFVHNTFPMGGSDEYYYHLLGPKLWSDAGRIYFEPKHPVIMQCSYWEYLYLWGFALLGEHGRFGLIEGQLFARWSHVCVGLLGSSLMMIALFRPFAKSTVWLTLAVVAAVCTAPLDFAVTQGKNDFGVILWVLTGAHLLLNQRSHDFIAGLLLGASVAGKYTTALTVVPLVGVWAWREKSAMRLFTLASSSVTMIAPIVIRNWVFTSNPLYPAFNKIFHSPWASSSWTALQSRFESESFDITLWGTKQKIRGLISEAPYILGLLGLPFVRDRRKFKQLLAVGLISFCLLVLKAKVGRDAIEHFVRLLGPGLVILVGTGILVLEDALSPFEERFRMGVVGIIAVVALNFSLVPWKIWSLLPRMPSHTESIRLNQTGGLAKAWLRLHAANNELILSSGDNQFYYLSGLNVVAITLQPELDAMTYTLRDPTEILFTLRRYGGKYLLDTRHWFAYSWGRTAFRFDPLLRQHPEALVFASQSADVYDLELLEEMTLQSCVAGITTPTADFLSYTEQRGEP